MSEKRYGVKPCGCPLLNGVACRHSQADMRETLEAIRDASEVERLRAELDEERRKEHGTPCKCESWIETCRKLEAELEKEKARMVYTEYTTQTGATESEVYTLEEAADAICERRFKAEKAEAENARLREKTKQRESVFQERIARLLAEKEHDAQALAESARLLGKAETDARECRRQYFIVADSIAKHSSGPEELAKAVHRLRDENAKLHEEAVALAGRVGAAIIVSIALAKHVHTALGGARRDGHEGDEDSVRCDDDCRQCSIDGVVAHATDILDHPPQDPTPHLQLVRAAMEVAQALTDEVKTKERVLIAPVSEDRPQSVTQDEMREVSQAVLRRNRALDAYIKAQKECSK